MKHQKRGFNSLGDAPGFEALSTSPSDASSPKGTTHSTRWFFMASSATYLANEQSGAYMLFNDACETKTDTVAPYSRFWPSLIVRHRASQLVTSLEGLEFLRYLAIVPFDLKVAGEWHEWLLSDKRLAALKAIPEFTHLDVAKQYVSAVTSVVGCNAHVTHRDLAVAILGRDRSLITEPSAAELEYPVDDETMQALFRWANYSFLSGSESFMLPLSLDTVEGTIATLAQATRIEAQSKAQALSAAADRVAQMRGRTLARRGSLSPHVFFQQATKPGLDYVRR